MSKLKYIADISNGKKTSLISTTLPSGEEKDAVQLINSKSIKSGKIIEQELQEIKVYEDVEVKYLKDGDILVPKDPSKEAIYLQKVEGRMLANQDFIIVSVKPSDTLLPEYVAWWLNRTPARREIHSNHQRATYNSKALNLDSIRNVDIKAPVVSEQKKAIELTKNILHMEELLLKKIKLQKDLVNGVAQRIEKNGTIKKVSSDGPEP